MIFASGLSFVRFFLAAAILNPDNFLIFSIFFSVGSLYSTFLSYGLIEGTIKQFPRLIIDGKRDIVVKKSKNIFKQIFIRAVATLLAVYIFNLFLEINFLRYLMLGVIFSFFNCCILLVASIQRSLFNPTNMGFGHLIRSIISLVLLISFTNLFGLYGAMIAEIIGALIGFIASMAIVTKTKSDLTYSNNQQENDLSNSDALGARNLFFSYLILSIPIYLDRSIASVLLTNIEAASYAFLAIFLSASTILINTLSQKLGPEIIFMIKEQFKINIIFKKVISNVLPLAFIWFLAVLLFFLGFQFNLVPQITSKYVVNPYEIFLIGVIGCTFVTAIFDFALIGFNKEDIFLKICISYIFLYTLSLSIFMNISPSLSSFLMSILVARLTYSFLILYNLSRLKHE